MRRLGALLVAVLCLFVFAGCHRHRHNDYTTISTTVVVPGPTGHCGGDDHGQGRCCGHHGRGHAYGHDNDHGKDDEKNKNR